MSRHSKNNTSKAILTAGQRSKLTEWGTQTSKISTISQKKFQSCSLCLCRAKQPCACSEGHLFCRMCIIENLAIQKKDQKRRQKLWLQQIQEQEEKQRLQSYKQDIKRLKLLQSSTSIVDKSISKQQEKESKTISFWRPDSIQKSDSIKQKRPDKHMQCPSSGKKHYIKLKDLLHLKLDEPDIPTKEKQQQQHNTAEEPQQFQCYACQKQILYQKVGALKSCGHVFCYDCLLNYSIKGNQCYVCQKPCRKQDILKLEQVPTTKALKFAAPTQADFEEWKLKHSKEYFSQEQHNQRFEIWTQNYYDVKKHNFYHNLGQQTYRKQLNKFSDLSSQQFRNLYLSSFNLQIEDLPTVVNPDLSSDITIDWVAAGSVTPVRNQGQCGGCWAFTSTSSVQSIYHIQSPQSHPLTELSVQQLLDCPGEEGNMGCSGGFTDNAFKYLLNHKLETNNDYPYIGNVSPTCQYDSNKGLVQVTNYIDVSKNNNSQMLAAVEQQTVSVMIDATVLQTYSSGIITESSCSKNLNHYVTIVGVNVSQNGEGYWKIQSSWGADWGQQGYARLEYGGDTCGILEQGNYPVLAPLSFEQQQLERQIE